MNETPRGLILLLALTMGTGAVRSRAPIVHQDLRYNDGANPKQRLDLTLPAPPADGFATILLVHGGSLTSGDRKEDPFPALCRTFADTGIACAAPSYRLFPQARWPEPLDDVADAAAWLVEHVARHRGDPRRIVLVGHSSGCQLVALAATDARVLRARGLEPASFAGVVPIGCRLDPRIDPGDASAEQIAAHFRRDVYDGGFGDLETRNAASPMLYVGSHVPPARVLLADAERFFPPVLEEGARFVRLLLESDVDADLVVFPDRLHQTLITRMTEPGDPAFGYLVRWIDGLPPAGAAHPH